VPNEAGSSKGQEVHPNRQNRFSRFCTNSVLGIPVVLVAYGESKGIFAIVLDHSGGFYLADLRACASCTWFSTPRLFKRYA